MEKTSTTMMAVLLVVGLIVGAGAGYLLAPPKIDVQTKTITVEKHPLDGKTVTFGYFTDDEEVLDFEPDEDFQIEETKEYIIITNSCTPYPLW